MLEEFLLKPCPFCGSRRLKIVRKNGGSEWINELGYRIDRHYFTVRCKKCFARGGTAGGLVPDRELDFTPKNVPDITTDTALREEAVKIWNERS